MISFVHEYGDEWDEWGELCGLDELDELECPHGRILKFGILNIYSYGLIELLFQSVLYFSSTFGF